MIKSCANNRLTILSVIVFVILLLLNLSTAFARKPSIRFSTAVELPQTGLRLNIMPDAKEVPMAMPRIYTYEIHSKDTKQPVMRVDAYSALELWRRSQYEAGWMDKFSNSLIVAKMKGLIIPEARDRHIPVSEIDKVTNTLWQIVEWDDTSRIARWVADFTGVKEAFPVEIKHRQGQFSEVYSFKLTGAPANWLAYSFKLRPNMFSRRSSEENWFFILVEVHPEIDIQQARKVVESELLGSIGWGRGEEASVDVSRVFQKKDATKEGTEHAGNIEDMRSMVRESIKNLRDWWYIETPHYILLSNLDTKYRSAVKELQDKIEILYSVWQKLMPPVSEASAGVIRIFKDPGEYIRYVGEEYEWTLGLWIASRQELVIRPVDWGGTKERMGQMLRVIYHEAFHQYLFHALDRIEVSPWYNEGHAAFFENVVFDGRRVNVEEDREKVGVIEKLARDNALEIGLLLQMSLAEFYAGDERAKLTRYSLAWGLIYYLRKGVPASGNEQYAGILQTYRDVLLKTKDHRKATNEAFAGINLAELQREMSKFWLSQRLRTKAQKTLLVQEPERKTSL